MNIYVSKLSFDTTSESLKELFAEYGKTTSVNVITDRATGFSRGFGFVEMANDTDGRKAIEELNDTVFEGKTINVSVARPRSDRNRGGWEYNRRQF
ncbi:RNA recognition motif domain-containing protein [Maribellus maritimus]|uniref:RNA recognition motif domain-containing protein n=1 Tax=Maribellus maritimus TaxID=2870838 RepID=UPI001EEA4059|nr:RNA-binding protein [Maribellus maritimus]MCG6190380.1 RNA-binding protein [Maribellus maritimus]